MAARSVIVQSLTNQVVIADKCIVAERFFDRLIGLIGKKKLEPGEAMLFPKCNDIHMWFMSIPIDVVFVRREARSEEGRDENVRLVVTSTRKNARPWRALPLRDGSATDTLELGAGTVERLKIKAGDELCIS